MKIQPKTINEVTVEDINVAVSDDVVRVVFLDSEGTEVKTQVVKNPELLEDVSSLVETKLGITII